jgi:NUMOD3 motif
MSNSCKGVNNPFLGKIHSNKSLALIKAALNRKNVPISSIEVEVIDLYINITTVY